MNREKKLKRKEVAIRVTRYASRFVHSSGNMRLLLSFHMHEDGIVTVNGQVVLSFFYNFFDAIGVCVSFVCSPDGGNKVLILHTKTKLLHSKGSLFRSLILVRFLFTPSGKFFN